MLNCSASLAQSGEIYMRWRKDGQLIGVDDQRKVLLPTGTLVVHRGAQGWGDSDTGQYECIARNGAGSIVSRPCRLQFESEKMIKLTIKLLKLITLMNLVVQLNHEYKVNIEQ